MLSSIGLVAELSGFHKHSGHASITGITPRSMAIARRLIFWYLLTLQKSVMQTVRSANAPYRMMAGKWSLLSRVTISKAELAIRSTRYIQTHNSWCERKISYLSKPWMLLGRHRTLFASQIAYFEPWFESSVANIATPFQRVSTIFNRWWMYKPYRGCQGWRCGSWYVQRVSKSPSGIWNEVALPSLKNA